MTKRTRRVQRRRINRPRAIIHTANAIDWSRDLVSRRVHGHGDRPFQCSGVHTLEAVASAQRRFVSQRNPGKKSPMDGCFEEYGDEARADEMLCMQAATRILLDQPGWCGHKID
jgi:hypothetical protein